MLFVILYSAPYPEHHFGIGYPYPPDYLKSDMDILKRIRHQFRCGNYPIRYTPSQKPKTSSVARHLMDLC
jgi:hypothetical protein